MPGQGYDWFADGRRCIDCGLWLDRAAVHHCEAQPVTHSDFPDENCMSCGAEFDHYLGCPDDPNPDYEAEAAVRSP